MSTIKQARQIETIVESQPRLDLAILRKRSNSKTPSGLILSYTQKAKKDGNLDLAIFLQELYKQIYDLETSEKIRIKSWKSKSSFRLIENPDRFIVITWEREDQDSEPIEHKVEITKEDVNKLLLVLNKLWVGQKLNTRLIGETLYGLKWGFIFSNRSLHFSLNNRLRILDYLGIIHYRGKFTEVLKQVKDIQTYLK